MWYDVDGEKLVMVQGRGGGSGEIGGGRGEGGGAQGGTTLPLLTQKLKCNRTLVLPALCLF